jgi:hypothetical protein
MNQDLKAFLTKLSASELARVLVSLSLNERDADYIVSAVVISSCSRKLRLALTLADLDERVEEKTPRPPRPKEPIKAPKSKSRPPEKKVKGKSKKKDVSKDVPSKKKPASKGGSSKKGSDKRAYKGRFASFWDKANGNQTQSLIALADSYIDLTEISLASVDIEQDLSEDPTTFFKDLRKSARSIFSAYKNIDKDRDGSPLSTRTVFNCSVSIARRLVAYKNNSVHYGTDEQTIQMIKRVISLHQSMWSDVMNDVSIMIDAGDYKINCGYLTYIPQPEVDLEFKNDSESPLEEDEESEDDNDSVSSNSHIILLEDNDNVVAVDNKNDGEIKGELE